jgi:GTPase Era involved in 16S rRNA processing
MLLTKIDLLPYISFDVDSAVTNARKVHPGMDIVKVSCTTGEGIDDWMNWIQRKRSRKSPPHKQWSNIPVSDSTMESMVQVQKSHFEHFIP